MLEKIEKYQIVLLAIILAFGMFFSTKCAVNSLSREGITVTGSAYKNVKSDMGKLSFEIVIKEKTKAQAYQTLKMKMPILNEYLKSKGIDDINIKTPNGYYSYKYNQVTGNYTNEVERYNLDQPIEIKSNDVSKIKEISLDISNLINKGVDINVYNASYYYSNLSDLKVELLQAATDDAKLRASAMLEATHNKVGKIQSVKMGVFQITDADSTDVSDMGINDTSTIEKKVTAVANVVFKIK